MKTRFLIDYENAHWCGGQLNVVVWANDEEDARDVASDHMEEEQRALFEDHYNNPDEDEDYSDESAVSITSVEEFNETHDQWEFFMNPSQRAAFYPEVGQP